MVADGVAGCGYGSGDGRALADEVANHKEGGVDVVEGEDFEEALGGEVVGAIVEGEGDLGWVGGIDDGFAEDLGAAGEGGVGPCCCCGG